MSTNNFDLFSEISINSDSEDDYFSDSDSDDYFKKPTNYRHLQNSQRHQPPLEPVDFEKYVRDNCHNKIKILQRSSFHQISQPIVIFFNHFQEKCAYHTKYLDRFYELALKYGDRIEFIAADMLDIDIMNTKWYSIEFFCNLVSPETETVTTYAIDEEKRIIQLYAAEQTMEILTEWCEQLLNGSLFKSQPLPVADNSKLVKICVHDNYKELVANSRKDILLVVGLEDYSEINLEYEPNYESVAEHLCSDNVDVVYINGDKNYIPFEFGIFCYPTLIFIPADDKSKFVDFLRGPRNTENIINCLRQYLNDSKSYLDEQCKKYRKYRYKPLEITPDFNIDFEKLSQYLQENCQNNVRVFERNSLLEKNRFIIITFMHFPKGKCLAQHLKWIDKIYQVATHLTCFKDYLIADFKDIDVINPQWKLQEFIDGSPIKPKVFGIDRKGNKFALNDFKTAASLFYFAFSLTNGKLFYSQPWPNTHDCKLVKTCIAENLTLCISSIKKDIFLAIYYSNLENTTEFLQQLENIATEMKYFKLKIIQIDARLNYIPLEMNDTKYPLLYFIPQENKSKRIRFEGDHLVKEEIVDFIRKNLQRTNLEE